MNRIFDVIIIGAGPAGAAAAIRSTQLGLSVLIIEKEKFPRYKPCAGGLTLKTLKILELMKVEISSIVECNVRNISISSKGDVCCRVKFEEGVVRTVSREVFDSLLIKIALSNGAQVIWGERVIKVENNPEFCSVESEHFAIKSKYVIGADGINGISRRLINNCLKKEFQIAVEMEVEDGNDSSDKDKTIFLDINNGARGYSWCFPKANGWSAGTSGFFKKKSQIRREINHLKFYWSWLSCGKIVSESCFPIPVYSKALKIYQNRFFLAGDAASFVDPFLEEGIFYAIWSGKKIAESIHMFFSDPRAVQTSYELTVRSFLNPEFRIASRFRDIVFMMPNFFCRMKKKTPVILSKFGKTLSLEKTYTSFYRLGKQSEVL